MESLWRISAKVREPIELPFGVVSGVGPGIGVLDGIHIHQGKGEILGFFLERWGGVLNTFMLLFFSKPTSNYFIHN